MNFLKQHKNKIIFGVLIFAALLFTLWWGGDSPALRGFDVAPQNTVLTTTPAPTKNPAQENQPTPEPSITPTEVVTTPTPTPAVTPAAPPAEQKDVAHTTESNTVLDEQATEDLPAPMNPEQVSISDKELTCTLSVRCDTVLANIAWLAEDKAEIVPKDGIIFAEKTVTFYEGESVFNLLVREMKQNKIHLEFENTPLYDSAYIEGIGNLYEFDCGELSGWMYKVNGRFPNYGCSRYQLQAGDRVEWVYSCDLGQDVGGYYAARNGR